MKKTSKKENEIIAVLSRAKLFSGVPLDQIEHIVASGAGYLKRYRKGEIVIRSGDVLDIVSIVIKGTILVSRLSQDGSESLVHVLKERKTIGIEFIKNYSYRSVFDYFAQTDVELYCIPHKYFTERDLLDEQTSRKILINMVGLMTHENLRQNQKLYILSRGSIRKKLLLFLSYEYEKCNSYQFDISFNRESLAAYLSVNRSALSREISQMEQEGLIRTKGKHFEILDAGIIQSELN